MAKIDIAASGSKSQGFLLWAILIAFCWFVFVRSGPATWGAANNIEIRRYQAGADLSTAEPWVQELYKLSEGLQPCAVVSIGDGVEIIPIEDDLLEELEGLR